MYDSILKDYSDDEIIKICKYLNKEYNIYDTDDIRWEIIRSALFKTSFAKINAIKNVTLSNRFISDIFLKYYACERIVKYHFIKFLKSSANDIVVFEKSIGDSRVDVCRINGKLCAYEIKTEFDSYKRLKSQMRDYFKAFDKIYVVVPICNADVVKNFIPQKCGVISYKVGLNNQMHFSYHRAAQMNEGNIIFCLESLSGDDLKMMINLLGLKPYSIKRKNLELLKNMAREKNIWSTYKRFLREKYKEQWFYLKENFDKILPIDCQSFFSSKMDPSILYEK